MDHAKRGTSCVCERGTILPETREVLVTEHERSNRRTYSYWLKLTIVHMIDYGGISASRLEVLEERLKDDVIAELNAFGGRLVACLVK